MGETSEGVPGLCVLLSLSWLGSPFLCGISCWHRRAVGSTKEDVAPTISQFQELVTAHEQGNPAAFGENGYFVLFHGSWEEETKHRRLPLTQGHVEEEEGSLCWKTKEREGEGQCPGNCQDPGALCFSPACIISCHFSISLHQASQVQIEH